MSASVQWASPSPSPSTSPSTSINNIKSHLYHKLKQKLFKVKEVRDMKIVSWMIYPKYYLWYFAHLYSKSVSILIYLSSKLGIKKLPPQKTFLSLKFLNQTLYVVCRVFCVHFESSSLQLQFPPHLIFQTHDHIVSLERKHNHPVYFKCKENCVHWYLHFYLKFSCSVNKSCVPAVILWMIM